MWSRILVQRLCGLGEFVQVEVTLDIRADAPVRQGELQGLAFLDVVQRQASRLKLFWSVFRGGVAVLFLCWASGRTRPAGRLLGLSLASVV